MSSPSAAQLDRMLLEDFLAEDEVLGGKISYTRGTCPESIAKHSSQNKDGSTNASEVLCDTPVSVLLADLCREVEGVDEPYAHKEICGTPISSQLADLCREVDCLDSSLLREDEEERKADEERIAKLREEVEELRKQAESGKPFGGVALLEGEDSLCDLDGSLISALGGTDVDDILNEQEITDLEQRVGETKQKLRQMETQVEDQLGELDKLLIECEQLHVNFAETAEA